MFNPVDNPSIKAVAQYADLLSRRSGKTRERVMMDALRMYECTLQMADEFGKFEESHKQPPGTA